MARAPHFCFRVAWLCAACLATLPVRAAAPAQAAPAQVAAPKDVGELQAIEKRVQQTVAKVLPCTVALRGINSQGSGVIVSKEGHILTAGHVIAKAGDEFTVTFQDGKTAKAAALGQDRIVDSGMVKLTGAGPWPFVELGRSEGLTPGSWCVTLGHPFGYMEGRPPVVRLGRVLVASETVLRTDCAIVAGDSGGPVFDLDGKLIGINSRIGSEVTMNYHVPIDQYKAAWDRLASGETIHGDLPVKGRPEVKAPFRAAVAEAGKCVARVCCDGGDAVLGTIVGPQGWIVTKASELKGKVTCRLRDGREFEARTIGVSTEFDLAMLKVEAEELPRIDWATAKPGVGGWLVSAGLQEEPLSVGVVSVPERRIPPPSGILGVLLDDGEGGVKIRQVMPQSAAEKAGLRVNDVITHVNGKAYSGRTELIGAVKGLRPGTAVQLGIRRGKESLAVPATLATLETPGTRRRDLQNLSAGAVSTRRNDFPLALQHDSVISPTDCGGPVVDLKGKVVGINIARAGRTETYAVPTEQLLGLMYELMSGRLGPKKNSR